MKTDVQLQHDVLAELDWEPSIDAAQIGVTVSEGIVALSGHVPTYPEKLAVEDVVKRVHGTKAVANDIEVRPIDCHARDDAEIAAAAVHALGWDAKVPQDCIQVTVRDGWITLEGSVSRRFEKKAADRAVRRLIGARGVRNHIGIQHDRARTARPAAKADEIKARIQAALKRSATVDSRRISVEIEERRVILSGDVHSHAEFAEAERIAGSAPEIAMVENDITITPWGCGPAEEWGY